MLLLFAVLLVGASSGCDPGSNEGSNPWVDPSLGIHGQQPAVPAVDESPEQTPVFPDKIPVPEGTKQVEAAVMIDGNASTRRLPGGPLYIEGYYIVQFRESSGLPRANAVPTFRRMLAGKDANNPDEHSRKWPHEEEQVLLPLDGRSHLVAWVDLDGNRILSTGDRVSPALPPLESPPEGAVKLRIDRIYVDPDASAKKSARPAPPRSNKGERNRGRQTTKGTQPLSPDQPNSGCGSKKKGTGCLIGMVTRTIRTPEDGIGTLVLIVYSSPPFLETKSTEIARVVVPKLNLSGERAQYPFAIPGIKIRPEPYSVVAAFDDSGDLNTKGVPQLRMGDLAARLGEDLSWPTAVVTGQAPVLLDLDLNFFHDDPMPDQDE